MRQFTVFTNKMRESLPAFVPRPREVRALLARYKASNESDSGELYSFVEVWQEAPAGELQVDAYKVGGLREIGDTGRWVVEFDPFGLVE